MRKEKDYQLNHVLEVANIAKSVYHYWKYNLGMKEEKDAPLIKLIKQIIEKHNNRVGYRRITLVLKEMGHKINHKRVLRLTKENNLLCTKFSHKSRSYKSYKGNTGKIAKNILNRRFMSDRPYQKLLTDITQFNIMNTNTKLYLSPVLDVFSKEIIAYSISKNPTLDLAMSSLDEAILNIPQLNYRTTVHSDQGWHYQHKLWVGTLKNHRIFQSMSRKGNCYDNSPMENFFGLLKQEMFYGEEFSSYEELELEIHKYIEYYNNVRRKINLKGKTPVEYRNLALKEIV